MITTKKQSTQFRARTPYDIARINYKLMKGRMSPRDANSHIEMLEHSWQGVAGQFEGRRVRVNPEFLAGRTEESYTTMWGHLGGLSVEEVKLGQRRSIFGRDAAEFTGHAIVAHLTNGMVEPSLAVVSLPEEYCTLINFGGLHKDFFRAQFDTTSDRLLYE
jgi:hypothetical protein